MQVGTNQKIDSDMMPRPLKMLNSQTIRAGIPDRFLSKGTDIPPSSGIPYI